jgi:hypothetical protein
MPHPTQGQESWDQVRLHLMTKLREIDALKKEVNDLRVQIAVLSTKIMLYTAGIAGAISLVVNKWGGLP